MSKHYDRIREKIKKDNQTKSHQRFRMTCKKGRRFDGMAQTQDKDKIAFPALAAGIHNWLK